MKKIIVCMLVAFVTSGGSALLAGDVVEETRQADSNARVMVDNLAGSVVIRGWDKAEVKVRAVLGDDVEGLDFHGDSGYLTIEVEIPRSTGRGHWDLDADLEIWVPRASRLEVETVSASIEGSGLNGRVDFESVSGKIEVEGSPGEASLSTVSGQIRFDGATEQLEAETVSGSIRLSGVSGTLEASSVSGRIEASAKDLDRGTLESVSGSVELTANLTAGARLDLESHSANVTLSLPADTSASFDLETFSGHIENELGPDGKRTSRYGPGKRVDFTMGSGDARVTVETFSGNVRLRRR